MAEKPSFDAELVGVIDHELTMLKKDMIPVYVKLPEQGGTLLKTDERIVGYCRQYKNRPKGVGMEAHFEELRANQGLPAEVLQILTEGRVKATWLVDSIGGMAFTAKRLKSFMQDIQKRGGETHSYAGAKAYSGAALAWQSGEKRSTLNDTQLMWHTTGRGDLPKNKALADLWLSFREGASLPKSEDLKEMEDFFTKAKEPYRSEIFDILREDHDDRHEVCLDGTYAAKAGLADKTFGVVADMKADFAENFPWILHGNNRVTRFWAKQKASSEDRFIRRLLRR